MNEYNKCTLYEFNVLVEENPNTELPYRLIVDFSIDNDSYEGQISIAKNDQAFLTRRTLPFLLRLLHQEKNFLS